MTKNQRFVLGLLIIFAALIAYALLADAARDKGAVVWIIVAALAVAVILPAAKFKGYREALKGLGMGVLNALSSLLEGNEDKSLQDQEARLHGRKRVPAALRKKVISKAYVRCQAPRCPVRDSKNLHVHHINMNPSESYDESNLIALCQKHHSAAHHDREVTIEQVRRWARQNAGPVRRTVRRPNRQRVK